MEVRYSKTRRFSGIIAKVNIDGTCDVDYDQGGREEEISRILIYKLNAECLTDSKKDTPGRSVDIDHLVQESEYNEQST